MSTLQKCPVCDDLRREQIYRTRDRHYKIPGEWNVARCVTCGLVQIAPMLTAEELLPLYPSDFYAFQDQRKNEKSVNSRLKRILFPSLYVKDPRFPAPGCVLDSGCGTGWSLLKFRSLGWNCVGVEPNEVAAQFGRECYGLDIKHGTVHTQVFPDESFDYIRSNHSLEHDPEPGATLQEFRRILKKNGRILVGVPNIDSAPARWFGKYWWYLGAPVHTYNFSRRHLTKLAQRYGFVVESVRYTGNYGGVIGSLQIYLNRNDVKLVSTDGWLINSMSCRVIGQAVSAFLNAIQHGDAIELILKRQE